MDRSVVDVLASLSLRDVPRVSPHDARAWLRDHPELAARDHVLVEAVIAVRAGAPREVGERLAADASPLASAIRVAAHMAERNRFPGGRGAVLEEGDVEAFVEPPIPGPSDVGEAVLTLAIGHVDAMVTNWKSISSGDAFGLPAALARARELAEFATGAGAGWLASYLRLVAADLHRRAGDRLFADGEARAAIDNFAAAGDVFGVAAGQVMIGDWYAGPHSSPELLDLAIDATPPGDGPVDLAAARASYADARDTYRQVSELGAATVVLREGYVARAMGDLDAWAGASRDAEQLAAHAEDRWLAALAAVHGALASVEAGGTADVEDLTKRAAALHEAGGRSWVRGLVRLGVAHSTQLRDPRGAFVAARRSLEIARGMATASQAPLEVVDVTDRLLELYGRHSFPVSRAVLELATVEHALDAGAVLDDPLVFGDLANRAMSAVALGTRAIDGDVLLAAAGAIERLLSATAPMAGEPLITTMRDVLASSAATSRVAGPLYASRAAGRDGRIDEADDLIARALAALEAPGADHPVLRAVVLGTIGRRDEARAIVDELARQGLDADSVARLYLRLGAADAALGALNADVGGADVDDTAWDGLAVMAQALVATGHAGDAAAIADAGIEAFEIALARQARDVLKSSATEDLDAADLYLVRILADLPAAAAGDPAALRRSFATSDRARSVSNSERITGTRTEAALRRWLALGSAWAATYEEVGAMVEALGEVSIGNVRARVQEIEARLDDAEDDLLSSDAAALTTLQARRPPLDVDAVAAALPPDAVLLQYHCWNDELIAWSLTADDLRVYRQTVDGRLLARDVGLFRLACAGRRPWDAALVDRLTEVLGRPWLGALGEHERVLVVPHGILAGLPFQLLEPTGAALARTHVVSYAPSAAHVPYLATGAALGRPFVLGDPAYGPSAALRRLPGSGVEAHAAAAALGVGHVYIGAEATRDAVVEHAPGATLLHFGTHGLLDDRWPNRARLALAGDDQLTIADLLDLDIEGALVVLSACNTGRGRATAGGDVVGLIRAVLASGAGNVVASLWPVDDLAGCLLMARFYDALTATGAGDVAVAMTRAAREVAALAPAERAAEYAERARRVGSSTAPAGTREARPVGDRPVFSDVAAWAPFVYVGR